MTLSASEHLECWNHSMERSLPVLGENEKQLHESAASQENQPPPTLQKEDNKYQWPEESSWKHHILATWNV